MQTVATLGFYPTNLTADAAYDAWYIYERAVHHGGIAAIPLNQHGHPVVERDADGVPLCAAGLRMVPQFPFAHTNGYTALRFRCPLVFPQPRDFTCRQPQFASGRGCVKDLNWEKGGLMRVLLNRDSPQFATIYRQRTSCERVNSHSKEQFGLAHPKVRNQRSVEHLTTLTYILINLKALQRARLTNRLLLRPASPDDGTPLAPLMKMTPSQQRRLLGQRLLSLRPPLALQTGQTGTLTRFAARFLLPPALTSTASDTNTAFSHRSLSIGDLVPTL